MKNFNNRGFRPQQQNQRQVNVMDEALAAPVVEPVDIRLDGVDNIEVDTAVAPSLFSRAGDYIKNNKKTVAIVAGATAVVAGGVILAKRLRKKAKKAEEAASKLVDSVLNEFKDDDKK